MLGFWKLWYRKYIIPYCLSVCLPVSVRVRKVVRTVVTLHIEIFTGVWWKLFVIHLQGLRLRRDRKCPRNWVVPRVLRSPRVWHVKPICAPQRTQFNFFFLLVFVWLKTVFPPTQLHHLCPWTPYHSKGMSQSIFNCTYPPLSMCPDYRLFGISSDLILR